MTASKKVAPPLEELGLLVRETRRQRGLTQQRAAAGAHVSRKQLAALERGENVSVVFVQKVATYLGISNVPLGGGIVGSIGASASAPDVQKLLAISDDLLAVVGGISDRIRMVAVDAALPPAEQATGDASVIDDLLADVEHLPADVETNLVRTMENLASGDITRTTPPARQRRPREESKRRKREA